MKRLKNIKGSLANRLSLWVAASTALVFFFIALFVSIMVAGGIIMETMKKAEVRLDNAGDHVDMILIEVETAVRNTIPAIDADLYIPDSMYEIVGRLVSNNKVISGAAIAFEPDFYPDRKNFSPYAYDDAYDQSDTLTFLQLGKRYNYREKDWYKVAKETGSPYWTEPYEDVGGGGFIMSTYCHPLFDNDDKFIGVVTADISLKWLTESLNKELLSFTESSFYFVLSRAGTFIAHPKKEKILNETIFMGGDNTKFQEDIKDVGKKMIAGEVGNQLVSYNDQPYYVFYSPIIKNGWSMAIVSPRKEFMSPVSKVSKIVLGLIFLGLLIIVLVCHIVLRRSTAPLRSIAKSADAISEGDFNATLPVIKTRDEIQTLRDSFESMQESLVHQMKELETVNEAKGRIEGELHVGSSIQHTMIPKEFPPFPDCPKVSIFGKLSPAKEVGGDLFDYYIRENRIYFCIADVSGKGVPAALLMAVARTSFRNLAVQEKSPAHILYRLNGTICDGNTEEMFITIFVGVLDTDNGKLLFCNGGHNAPVTIKQDGVAFLDVLPNLPLGIIDKWTFEEQEITLEKGESIFLYTDGLNESENKDKAQFGDDKILQIASGFYGKGVHEQIDIMYEAVQQHSAGAEQNDDLTMMTVQYLG